jgi:polyisoprenoid-binding protein YceI
MTHELIAKKFTITEKAGPAQVKFESKAPAEDIIGSATGISGSVELDIANIAKTSGMVQVQVTSMKTGIKKRDSHMYGADWLDAEKFPSITYKLTALENVRVKDKNAAKMVWEATAKGDFTLRGITKQVTLPVTITYLPESDATRKRVAGNLMAVEGSFSIALKDFNVQGTKGIIGDKVGEKISISLQLFGTDGE